MKTISIAIGALTLTLLGAGILGCDAAQDGDTDLAEVPEGKPKPDDGAPGRTAASVDAKSSSSEAASRAVRQIPARMDLAVDPDNDFYLKRALEPEAAGTVHVSITATPAN